MATIRERTTSKGEKRYQVIVRLKGQPPQTATFNRKTDAKKWAQDIESDIRHGRHFKTTQAKKHTLADLIDRYVQEELPKKPKSYRQQKNQLNWWKEQIGVYSLADITPSLLAETRNTLHIGRQPATVVRYMAALSHAFTIATNEWEWLDNNLMRKVSRPKEPRGRVRFLSDDERKKVLDACKSHDNKLLYPAVVLALSTGMRQAEIMTLTWQQIDLKRGYIILEETKNGERRAVPLVSHANELVRDMYINRRKDTELLFPSQIKPSRPFAIRTPWGEAMENTDIKDFHFHDLRHTAASYLAMNGASLAEIADILGHKTLQMVKRYAHLSEQHTSKVLNSMNEQIFT